MSLEKKYITNRGDSVDREFIRILVVDDHPSTRMGLVALLESQSDMDVVAEARDGEEAVVLYREILPDVVLMDLRMPGVGGVESILEIRRLSPGAKIVILSTYDWDEDIHRAIESGAMSYLLKDTSVVEIASTIRKVNRGETYFPKSIVKQLAKRSERQNVTARERDVLEALVKGRSNKEISVSLEISEETVKTHMRTLFYKLGVRDRTEAAIAAIRHGIVHLD